MPDDASTRENVIAVSFSEDANAYEALSRVKELDAKGEVGVEGAVVVVRDDDGKLVTKDEIENESVEGTVSGGLVGLLIGVLGGPLGVLVGGATGVLVGSLFDEDDTDQTESALADISKSLRVGSTGLLADVTEESPVAIDAVMANLGGTVLRRSAADVQAEVAAAEEAQREAKKQARKELRDARHKKQKAEIDAKLADPRAKLDRHKKPAAS
ncbi:MAG TPA: DUF1269 domain-containing protein [Solirubrobacteraceae bacterium]|nr:DUF1269 domain-containing protein [Solirubrobacteraceae bacterium]